MIYRMHQYADQIVGPVMYQYTFWVLQEAKKRNIKTLYFLARDGYSLYHIAVRLCERYGIDIECRYLYCSRLSLRTASYAVIDKYEVQDLLLLGGCYFTIKTILLRGDLDEEECEQLCDELNVKDKNAPLSLAEFNEFCEKLKCCDSYWKMVMDHSTENYKNAIGYFSQEKLLEKEHLAIVDSGWTGSMQRSLRQILTAAGFTGKLTGFYFGMYAKPKEPADGEYCTFYFNSTNKICNKVMFNNNLFECMLSAPHGMTKRYCLEKGKYYPVLEKQVSSKMMELVEAQFEGVMSYVERKIESKHIFCSENARKDCQKILRRCMVYPTKKEIDLFENFVFCDDITEGYHISLADGFMVSELKEYVVFRRIIRKIFQKNTHKKHKALFWPYAITTFAPKSLQSWYRFNIFVWEYLRFSLR